MGCPRLTYYEGANMHALEKNGFSHLTVVKKISESVENVDGDYRYGFQGQEKDNEIKGKGNSLNYKYRMHDARLGRFFAVDPLSHTFPYNSAYAFSENKVISHIEFEGTEAKQVIDAFASVKKWEKSQKAKNGGLLNPIEAYEPKLKSTSSITVSIIYYAHIGTKSAEDIANQIYVAEKAQWDNWSESERIEYAKGLDETTMKHYRMRALNGVMMAYVAPIAEAYVLQSEIGGTMGGAILSKTGQVIRAGYATKKLQGEVDATVETMKKTGQSPATVVGGSLPNGATKVGTSGTPPVNVAPSLESAANKIGGVGAKKSGNTIGCCGEFRTGNKLLLENPGYKPTDIKFTPAVRPRTGQTIPPCKNCQEIFNIKR